MKYKLVSESNHQKALVQQASSFEDSKCMNPEFIEELVERIVQRVTEKSNHDLEFYTINEVALLKSEQSNGREEIERWRVENL